MASARNLVHYCLTNGKPFESEPMTKSRFIDKHYRKTSDITLTLQWVTNNNRITTDIMSVMWISKQPCICIRLAARLAIKLNCSIWAICALTGHKMLSGRNLSCVSFAYRNNSANDWIPKFAKHTRFHYYSKPAKKTSPSYSKWIFWVETSGIHFRVPLAVCSSSPSFRCRINSAMLPSSGLLPIQHQPRRFISLSILFFFFFLNESIICF